LQFPGRSPPIVRLRAAHPLLHVTQPIECAIGARPRFSGVLTPHLARRVAHLLGRLLDRATRLFVRRTRTGGSRRT